MTSDDGENQRRRTIPVHPLQKHAAAFNEAFPTLQTAGAVHAGTGPFSDNAAHIRRIADKAPLPTVEFGEQIRQFFDYLGKIFMPVMEKLVWIGLETTKCQRLESAGWLPHPSSPFEMVEEIVDLSALDLAIEQHYRDNWPAIAELFRARIADLVLDEEAKSVFDEAVKAHSAGLYRCAARLLFPEVERLVRIELRGGSMDKMSVLDVLVEKIGGLTPAAMSFTGVSGIHLYYKLNEHLYAHVKNPDALATVAADPVPNRHAALHGYVAYSSFKNSINALIVADYLFQAISAVKRFEAEDADEEDVAVQDREKSPEAIEQE